ncbi:MAG TPA: DUF4058 family protein [Pirellulales bacterium]|nr:DUF4058 family protein [Pirellulales bacterium]
MTRVHAGIFHDFHHSWIEEIARALNHELLPADYYALRLLLAPPKVKLAAETDLEFYRRKQSAMAVRHVSGDRLVAMVEIVSRGNKSSRQALRSFVEKAAELLDRRIHLLIVDLHAPGSRDPHGIHAAIWGEIHGKDHDTPAAKPLTLVSYETALTVRAYVEPVAVGDRLTEMPLFLEPGAHVPIPLEAIYGSAFAEVPRRWRRVLDV